jgi:hypothetical protein
VTRLLLGIAGVTTILYGVRLLLIELSADALLRLPLWLGGAILADDLVIIPLTLTAGGLLTRWARSGPDGKELALVRTALLYVGITTLIAMPLILRQGHGANPTSLSRDYRQDWLLLEALIVTVALAGLMMRRLTHGRRARASRSGAPDHLHPRAIDDEPR